jgi:hypothetical protein
MTDEIKGLKKPMHFEIGEPKYLDFYIAIWPHGAPTIHTESDYKKIDDGALKWYVVEARRIK